MAQKAKRTYGTRRGSRKVGKRIDWFWEAYWKENGRDVSRRFSENAYGDGIAERKAREARHLFDDKIRDICDTLYEEGVNVMIGHEMMDKGTSANHQQTVEAWGKRIMWFNQQLDTLPKEFDRFLQVKK
jgi:hypothetical protein